MKPRRPRWPILVLILVAAATGLYWTTRPKPVEVVLIKVERGRVEETVSNTKSGTVKACRRAKIAPAAGGTVAKLPVRAGDRVRAGDLLLELWNEDLAAQARLAESQVQAARAQSEEACLLAGQAERDAVRITQLRQEGIAAHQAAEQAQAQRDAQAAACRSAQAALQQTLAAHKAALAALERTIVRAPFDGVVAERTAELGEVVIPSPPGIPTLPAIDLIETGCLYVEAPIDEIDAPRLTVGQLARVTLDALPGRPFPGKVRRVAPYVLDREKQSRTVDVEVEITDPAAQALLKPGLSADLEILLAVHEGVLRIPSETVQEGNRVLVLEHGRLAARQIQIGASNWRFTEIREGLTDGEPLVLSLDRPGVRAGAAAVPAAADPKVPAER